MSPAAVMESGAQKKVRFGQKVRANVLRELKKELGTAESIVVAQIVKVPTRDLNKLRQSLQEMESNLLVVKNSIGRIGFTENGWTELGQVLEGTCTISPIKGDVAAGCKLLNTFAKDHEGFVLRGGVLQGQFLQAQDVVALAKLPAREVLLSQVAGVLQSPIRNLAFVLQAPIRSLALALAAITRQKEK